MSKPTEKGLSAIQLALVFLSGVAVCAVFFALGFVVGRNQQPPTVAAETERVSPPAPTPTPVSAATGGAPSGEASNPSLAPPPTGGQANSAPGSSQGTQATGNQKPSEPGLESKSLPAAPASESARSAAPQTGVAAPAASPSTAAPAPGAGGIIVQVAATSARVDAERLVGLLKSRGYPALLVTPETAGLGDELFRVQVGPYKSRAEALGIRDKLLADGFKPFVRQPGR
jgi:cell division septation protein DedD